jgi:hypothetical protein
MIGRKILEGQLQRIEVLGADDTISNHPAFDTNYKICECYLYHLTLGSWLLFSVSFYNQCCWSKLSHVFSVGKSWRCNKHSVLWNSCSEGRFRSVISVEQISTFLLSAFYYGGVWIHLTRRSQTNFSNFRD